MTDPSGAPDRTWSCILFDLDGTIVDSAPGIISRMKTTLANVGAIVPSDADLLKWVGPPILESFRDFAGMNPEQSLVALAEYRSQVATEGAEAGTAVFPGVAGVLSRIAEAGIPLALATSKPESQANVILDHFGLSQYFTVICGASEDETRSRKADVVAEAVRRLTEQGVDLSRPVLVGDRHHDVLGAAEHGIPTILVEWGYGSPAEAEGALAVVHSTDALSSLLLG
ncbi:HAD hydrolase-like protein [Plantibacter sp. YIM 135347]|uniref:HAD hydrolase-like protein n=1 Tax=Plantibacter sp. YIM 135347 TaxID=3423919 RepID=UPI003D33D380